MRDAESKSQDLLCLDVLGIDALCKDTIISYKQRLLALRPEHVFDQGDENKFLEYLGAIRVGKDGFYHPTRAGLLMFGYAYKIVYEFPEYFVDYQEQYYDDLDYRWTDRLTSDTGDWSGNLYDFYCKASKKLTSDLKTPFMIKDITRIDETKMHKAVREALCNAIYNSDFYQPHINDTIYSLNEKKIITFLSNTDKVKAKDIVLAVGLSLSTVKGILYKLVRNGVVSTDGTIKDKKYFIIKISQN